MATLIINPGSASRKYAIFDGSEKLFDARFEENQNEDFDNSLENFLNDARDQGIEDINVAGIRIVSPGSFFQKHRRIDEQYLHELLTWRSMAPLHINPALKELESLYDLLPEITIVGVSDSAFHSTISNYASNYALPEQLVEELDIKRFGYHGISVSSVVSKIKTMTSDFPENIVVCHLGSGASLTAIKNGESIDTSMGMTPLEGLVMSTRAGDVDDGVLLYIQKKVRSNT